MLNTIRVAVIALIGMALSSVSVAQGLDTSRFFFGAGVSSNEESGTDSAGGYGFGEVTRNVFIDAEVGYMDTGDMEKNGGGDVKANGLWATGVGRLMIAPSFELIGRLGYDFGDDDGVMAGIGVGYLLTKKIKLRFEYVERDNVDSLQFNLVFQP
jgi:hypothetical protein